MQRGHKFAVCARDVSTGVQQAEHGRFPAQYTFHFCCAVSYCFHQHRGLSFSTSLLQVVGSILQQPLQLSLRILQSRPLCNQVLRLPPRLQLRPAAQHTICVCSLPVRSTTLPASFSPSSYTTVTAWGTFLRIKRLHLSTFWAVSHVPIFVCTLTRFQAFP